MEYILKGPDADKVIRENRIRIDRGVISITPVDTDAAFVETLREVVEASEKEHIRMTVAQVELAEMLRVFVAVAVHAGYNIDETVKAKLDKFGISVPKMDETPENTAEIVPEVPESVPTAAEEIPDDMLEVNLDDVKDVPESDTKETAADDTKDVPEADTKETAPVKKTSKRSKKSE